MTVDLSGSFVWEGIVGCVCFGQINSQFLSIIQWRKKKEKKAIPVKDEMLHLKTIYYKEATVLGRILLLCNLRASCRGRARCSSAGAEGILVTFYLVK